MWQESPFINRNEENGIVEVTVPDSVDEAYDLYQRNAVFNSAMNVVWSDLAENVGNTYSATGFFYIYSGETIEIDRMELGLY